MTVDEDGNVLLLKKGTKDGLSYSLKEQDILLESSGKSINTHNHPSGNSFSLEDIFFALSFNLKESRVVGKEYTYILHLKDTDFDKIKTQFNIVLYNTELRKKYLDLMEKGEINYKGSKQ